MATTYIPQSKFSWAKYMKLKRITGTLAIFVWNKPKSKKKKCRRLSWQFSRDDIDISDCLYMLAEEKNENILTLWEFYEP